MILNERNGNVDHVVNKPNRDAGIVDNIKDGNVDKKTEDVDTIDRNIVYNEGSPSVRSNSDSNCHIISAEIHNEKDVNTCVVSRDTIVEDEDGDNNVDIVNNMESKYTVNGDMIKRASRVPYKERAKDRVSMLIHRHTL